MSIKFPVLNYKQITKVAKRLGFYLVRRARGSHEVWRRDLDKRQTTIPNHGNKTIKRRTLKAILNDFGVTLEGLNKILKDL